MGPHTQTDFWDSLEVFCCRGKSKTKLLLGVRESTEVWWLRVLAVALSSFWIEKDPLEASA